MLFFYYDMLLSDKFCYLLFKSYYILKAEVPMDLKLDRKALTLLSAFIHALISCSRQCSEAGVLTLI